MSSLEPLRGSVRAKKFLTFDIESKADEGDEPGFERPFLVGIYDGEKYHSFRDEHHRGDWRRRYYWSGGCLDQAMRFLLKKKYRGWLVYGHNAGRFDYLHVLPWLEFLGQRHGFMFQVVPVASSIQLLSVARRRSKDAPTSKGRNRAKSWDFVDSYRLMPLSLDAAAKAFGLEGKLKHDLRMPESDPRWETYNEQDCRQLYEVMQRFHSYVEGRLGGQVGITAASTAVNLWRRSYLDHSVERNEQTHEFVRPSYVGGRCEPFILKGEKLRYYDINSSYPNVMQRDMPGELIGQFDGEIPWQLLNERAVGFVEADVYVDKCRIPPLPVRGDGKKLPNKLLFPWGHLRGTWDWAELSYALEHGARIERIHRSVWYEGDPFFRQFVEHLYPLRDQRREDYDAGLAAIAKILLNSCYGKTGQKLLRKKLYLWNDPELPENAYPASTKADDDSVDAIYWYAETEVDAPYIMPQTASHVTALARVEWHKWAMYTHSLGGNVYYGDTDSLIVDVELPTEPGMLGALKDEYPEQSGSINGVFLGPKMYLLESWDFQKVKYKGVELRRSSDYAGYKKKVLELAGKGYAAIPRNENETGDAWALRVAKKFENRAACRELEAFVKASIASREYNLETFRKLESNETVYQWRLEKIGQLIQDQFMHGPRMYEVPRSRHDNHDKRVILADGIHTEPIYVDMRE